MGTNEANIAATTAAITASTASNIVDDFFSMMDTFLAEKEIDRKGKKAARRKAEIKKENKKKSNNKIAKLAKQTQKFKHHGHKDHDVKFKGHVCKTPMANNSYREKRWATWATGSSKESLSAYIIYQMT